MTQTDTAPADVSDPMTETAADPGSASPVIDEQAEVISYERSPLDVLRVVIFSLVALLVVLATRYAPDGVDGLESNLVELLTVPTSWLLKTVDVVLFVTVTLASIVALVVPIATRRWRLFGYIITANVLASVVTVGINAWVDLDATGTSATAEVVDSERTFGLQVSTDVVSTTQMIAIFFALGPFVSRRWRRMGAWIIAIVLVLRLVASTSESTHAMLVLSVGAAVGSIVLLAYGRPTTRPRLSAILAALRSSGLPVSSMDHADVDARGSIPYFATLENGSRIFAKVLGSDQRAADLLFRFYRMIRLKNVGDERPFSSLRRTVEHEALVALQARDIGVRTPRLRCVAEVGRDAFLLSYDLIEGESLDKVEPEQITDDVLRGLWSQVDLLRRHRVAHRDLRLANVFLAADGEAWIIDFGFSEIAASHEILDADVAQLIASVAVEVGAERAVRPAVEVLGPEAVAASLKRLQPVALSGSTQSALKEHKGLLDEVRSTIEAECDVEEPELEPVTRFTGKQIFTLVMLAAVVYFLVPQLADLPGIVDEVAGADWIWLVPILAASVATYMAAGLAILGSVPDRLRYGPTFIAQVASSFASKVAPAGLGGMALNVRYLQRSGIDTAVATSSVGLNAIAGIVCHITLIVVYLSIAGREAFGDISLPSPRSLLIGVLAVVVIGALAMAVPTTRKLVTGKLLPILARATGGLRDVLTSPPKLVMLFGGSTIVTFSNAIAFYFAGRAFGLEVPFPTVIAVYLVGSAVATAAPTPGGLGAVEAALIAGLVAIGVDNEIAVPTVFLFRLATFWLPILPGWASFTWLRRNDHL